MNTTTSTGAAPAKAPAKGFAKAGAISMAGAVISAVTGFAFAVVLSRGYGEVGSGQVMQAVAVAMIAIALAKCGLDSTMLWRLPRLDQHWDRIRVTINFGLVVSFIAGTIAAAILSALAPVIAPEYAGILRMVIWSVPFGAAMFVALAALRGLGDIREFVVVGSIFVPGIRPIAVVVAALTGAAISTAGFLWALPMPVALVILLVIIRRRVASSSTGMPVREERRELSRYAAPRLVSQALEQLLMWLDVLIVGALIGAGAAGIYSGAFRFVMAGLIVDTAIRVVISPWFSAQLGKGEHLAAQTLYRRATMWLLLFSLPIYLVLGIFAPVPLSWLGPAFPAGAAALSILCVGTAIFLGFGPVNSLLLMSGHSGWAAINKAIAVTVNLTLNLILVPRFQIIGAAIAWSSAMAVDAFLAQLHVRRLLGIKASVTQFGLAIALPVITVATPAVIFGSLWGFDSMRSMLVTIACGGVLLLAAMAVARRPLGLDELRGVAKRPTK